MVKLWKFYWDCDHALIGGLFKATDDEVKALIGQELYLGEAEGKYSETWGTVDPEDISLVSDNPVVVEAVPEFGYNPLHYIQSDE